MHAFSWGMRMWCTIYNLLAVICRKLFLV
uniref:Uncharacterized protein n=1 Tax=Anguilla anguilla TaxID=7936 RepID=A0A0E9TTB0_ANGAN